MGLLSGYFYLGVSSLIELLLFIFFKGVFFYIVGLPKSCSFIYASAILYLLRFMTILLRLLKRVNFVLVLLIIASRAICCNRADFFFMIRSSILNECTCCLYHRYLCFNLRMTMCKCDLYIFQSRFRLICILLGSRQSSQCFNYGRYFWTNLYFKNSKDHLINPIYFLRQIDITDCPIKQLYLVAFLFIWELTCLNRIKAPLCCVKSSLLMAQLTKIDFLSMLVVTLCNFVNYLLCTTSYLPNACTTDFYYCLARTIGCVYFDLRIGVSSYCDSQFVSLVVKVGVSFSSIRLFCPNSLNFYESPSCFVYFFYPNLIYLLYLSVLLSILRLLQSALLSVHPSSFSSVFAMLRSSSNPYCFSTFGGCTSLLLANLLWVLFSVSL